MNCIDDIDVFLKEEKGVVVDAVWTGVACAISTASTDILCDLLIGKKSDEALNIIAQYDHMAPINEYLLLLDHPASKTPITLIDETAKM